jgi:hypothetical protein
LIVTHTPEGRAWPSSRPALRLKLSEHGLSSAIHNIGVVTVDVDVGDDCHRRAGLRHDAPGAGTCSSKVVVAIRSGP